MCIRDRCSRDGAACPAERPSRPWRATAGFMVAGRYGARMLNRVRPLATPLLWVVGVCGALLLLLPRGFPNYDTIYYLLWGRELAQGMSPDYGAPLAPTPHPLYDLLGAVVAPLGDGGVTVAMVVAYVSLALVGWLVYRLGREWLSVPVGIVAAAVV